MTVDFGCSVGDTLYIVDTKKNKVRNFKVDCLKIFENCNLTAHGYINYGKYSLPDEVSLKYLNKRVVFTKKKLATEWLNYKMKKVEG